MARKIKTQQDETIEPNVTVDVDTMDWTSWHSMYVPAIVEEQDDVEAPREDEKDPKDVVLQILKATQYATFSSISEITGLAQPHLFEIVVDIHKDGYCIVVEQGETDATVFFGLAAEAKLYEKIDAKPAGIAKPGRKAEVLALLQKHAAISIPAMAKALGITERNISSQLSYLRADGYLIGTNSRGWKVLEKSE